MKKLLLLAITASLSISTFAQKAKVVGSTNKTVDAGKYAVVNKLSGTAAKTTAIGDTVAITNINTSAGLDSISLFSYINDSGCAFGMNPWEDKGYAERYDVNPLTTSYKVLGVRALFGGKILPTSTKTVTFHVWPQAAKSVSFRPTLFNNGLPGTSIVSGSRPITQLGIGVADTASDTAKNHIFATPTAYLSDSFFVGYTTTYTWAGLAGDTIGLYSNLDNERGEVSVLSVSASDTTINNVNATMGSDNVWRDNATQMRHGLFNNLYILPIVVIGAGTSSEVGGITRKDFTFYGNYPNPANNSTNVKFALAHGTDVTIDVTDMTGRQVATIAKNNLQAGEHVVEINTSGLAAGEYVYIVHTKDGEGMGSVFTVVR